MGRRSGWRGFAIVAVATVVVLVAAYFVVTSRTFLKAVLVPHVGSVLHTSLTVGDASWNLLSDLELREVRMATGEAEPLFAAERVLVRYRAWSLWQGDFVFPEIVLESPVIQITERPDGTRNLDAVFPRDPNAAAAAPRAQPLRLELGRVQVSRGIVKFVRTARDGLVQASEATGIELGIDTLANDAEGSMKLSATVAQTCTPAPRPAGGDSSADGGYRMEARLDSGLKFTLRRDLRPVQAKGDAQLKVGKASGALRDLEGVVWRLGCDLTLTEVKELALQTERDGNKLGSVRLSGPIDQGKTEARIKFEATAIDRNVLNILGAPFGLDFAETTLNASGLLDVARRGETIAASGRGTATKFSVRRGGTSTPAVDLALDYQFTLSGEDESAVVHRLSLTGKQSGKELFSLGLNRAMNLAWGPTIHGVNDSQFRFSVSEMRLEDWRLFWGTNAPSGTANVEAKLLCQDDGQRFTGDVAIGVRDLAWTLPELPAWSRQPPASGPWALRDGTVKFTTRVSFRDYRSLLLEQYNLEYAQAGTVLVTASGSAGYDLVSEEGDVQANARAPVPQLLAHFPVPDFTASTGTVIVDGLVSREKGQDRLGLSAVIEGFAGAYKNLRFDRYEARLGLDGETTARYANLRRLELTARQGVDAFGGLDISGKYDRMLGAGEFRVNIENLSRSGLQPLIAPMLAPRQLLGGRFDGTGTARYEARGASALEFEVKASGVQVHDPSGALPGGAVDLQLGVEASYQSNVVNLRNLALSFPAGQHAPTNQILGRGMLHMPHGAPGSGEIRLASESLDLTWLLDAYRTNRPAPATIAAGDGSGVENGASTGAVRVAASIPMPLNAMTATVQVARLYLGEVVASNWTATAAVRSNSFQIDPFTLGVGGGSVAGSLRAAFTKPGGECALELRAGSVPLAPWLATLQPARRGQVRGELGGTLRLRATGITGPTWIESLTGEFEVGATNLALALQNIRNPILSALVTAISRIPAAADAAPGVSPPAVSPNPRGPGGLWADELSKAPLDAVSVRGKAGQGRLEVGQARVHSAAFRAEGTGTVILAAALTNSVLELPFQVAVSRALAERLRIVPAGTAAGGTDVKLPDSVTLGGTVGQPRASEKRSQ